MDIQLWFVCRSQLSSDVDSGKVEHLMAYLFENSNLLICVRWNYYRSLSLTK